MTTYDQATVTAVATAAEQLTGGAVKLGDVGNPGDRPRYVDGHSATLVWDTATSPTAAHEAAAYYAAAGAFWARQVLKDPGKLPIPLMQAASQLCGTHLHERIRTSYAAGRTRAENVYYGTVRELRRDGRYTVGLEYTGAPNGPHNVARLDKELIGRGTDEGDAWRLAYLHHVASAEPATTDGDGDTSVTAASETTAAETGDSTTTTGDAGGSGDVRAAG